MDGLIQQLERATEIDAPHVLRRALDYALDRSWITKERFYQAQRMIDAGASLDAALTLVPEGWRWGLICGEQPLANVWPSDDAPNEAQSGRSVTPAIALCIAALRARAAA